MAKNSVQIFIVIIGQTLKKSSSHLSGHTVIIVLLMLGAPKGKVINISLWQWRQCRGWSSEHGNDVQCMDFRDGICGSECALQPYSDNFVVCFIK